ncbi:hypothetical protein JCM3774_000248 [Rhodotorula dairenensis]
MFTSSPAAQAGAFTSPLGPVHLASPEEQGVALKAVLRLFRRSKSSPAAATSPALGEESLDSAGTAFRASSAARRSGLECKLERSTSFSVAYEPSALPAFSDSADEAAATASVRRLSPPPAYKVLGCATTLEEDILITESGEVFITAVTSSLADQKADQGDQLPIKVETPSERKSRENHERLERKRRAVLEQDRLLGEALDRLGM